MGMGIKTEVKGLSLWQFISEKLQVFLGIGAPFNFLLEESVFFSLQQEHSISENLEACL